MKKLIAFLLAVFLCMGMCACGAAEEEKGEFKMTTSYAADKMVKTAIQEWLSTKFLSFECTEFKYTITNTERSSRRFSGDDNGMMWYNAYGTVTFLNDYGDVLAQGSFTVFFGHNGVDKIGYMADETVINLK